MSKIPIMLEDEALIELHEVLLDEDAEAALTFLRKHIATQIPSKGSAACDSSRKNPYLLPPRQGKDS
jgi:hypothetical protein